MTCNLKVNQTYLFSLYLRYRIWYVYLSSAESSPYTAADSPEFVPNDDPAEPHLATPEASLDHRTILNPDL